MTGFRSTESWLNGQGSGEKILERVELQQEISVTVEQVT